VKRVTMTLAIVVVLGIGGASGALGDTLSSALDDFAVISGTIRGKSVSRHVACSIQHTAYRSDSRIPKCCILSTVYSAGRFPAFLSDTSRTAVSVVAHDCQTAWEGRQVSWTVPWRRPGGDFDSLSRAWFIALPGDKHPVVLDITETVRNWQQGKGSYGLFLKRPDAEGGGFREEVARLREALGKARVKYYFTHVQD